MRSDRYLEGILQMERRHMRVRGGSVCGRREKQGLGPMGSESLAQPRGTKSQQIYSTSLKWMRTCTRVGGMDWGDMQGSIALLRNIEATVCLSSVAVLGFGIAMLTGGVLPRSFSSTCSSHFLPTRRLLDCLSDSESPSTRKMAIHPRRGCTSDCGTDTRGIVQEFWACDVCAVQHESI